MKMGTNAMSVLAMAMAVGLVSGAFNTARGELLFYEGFDYTDGTQLHGQGGWTNDPNATYDGVSPATVSNTGSDDPFEIFDGTGAEAWDGDFTGVTQTGNFAGYQPGHMFATRSLDSSVTSAFTDGTTTWLSFINYRTSSRSPIVSIGAGPITGDRSRYSQDENIGMGAIYNSGQARALTWAGGGAQYDISATTIGQDQPQFLIAKIVWSDAGNDTISVVQFLKTDTISEANFDTATKSTLSVDFDQSLFDTISIGGANGLLDEVRIATTFEDAVTALFTPVVDLIGNEVASNAVPGTLVGNLTMANTNDASGFTYTLDPTGDYAYFDIPTGTTNLRTSAWMDAAEYNISIVGSKGGFAVTNPFTISVTSPQLDYLAYVVAAEVNSSAAGGTLVGSLATVAGDTSGTTYSIPSGRSDLFELTGTGNTNLTVVSGAALGTPGDKHYISIEASTASATNVLIVAVDVVSGQAEGTIFMFR